MLLTSSESRPNGAAIKDAMKYTITNIKPTTRSSVKVLSHLSLASFLLLDKLLIAPEFSFIMIGGTTANITANISPGMTSATVPRKTTVATINVATNNEISFPEVKRNASSRFVLPIRIMSEAHFVEIPVAMVVHTQETNRKTRRRTIRFAKKGPNSAK